MPVQRGPRFSPQQIGIAAISLVVVVVVVIVLVATTGGSNKPQEGPVGSRTAASPALVSETTSVPESVYQQVGLPKELTNSPSKVKGESALTKNGLPEMLYMGAEYCPYCASERWPMIMALSKFGTFSNLSNTFSSVSDFAPDTATWSFYKSTYTSKYLVFQPFELATNQPAASGACQVSGYACLETDYTAAESNLLQKLGGGSFPFIDFGNKLMQSGSGYTDQPLVLAGLTAQEIASDLHNAKSPVAQAEDGSANYFTAAICSMTGNQPSSVCSASYVKAAQKKAGV